MSSSGKEARPFDRLFFDKILSLNLGRREVLGYGALGLAGMLGTALLSRTVFGSNSSMVDSYQERDPIFKPGWIEEKVKADLIDGDPDQRGHLNFLREAIFNNPILFDSTVEYYQYLNDKASENERLRLGDMFSQAYRLVSLNLKGPVRLRGCMRLLMFLLLV